MDNENNELDNVIWMTDECGNDIAFEFLDLIACGENEYVVLTPAYDDAEEGELVILRIEDGADEDEESYVSVEDQAELDAVFKVFKDKFKELLNFTD